MNDPIVDYIKNTSPDNLSADAMRWAPDLDPQPTHSWMTPKVIHAPQLSEVDWTYAEEDEPMYLEDDEF